MKWYGHGNRISAYYDYRLTLQVIGWSIAYFIFLWFIITSRRRRLHTFAYGSISLFSGALLSIGIQDSNWMTGTGELKGSYSRWTEMKHGHSEMLIPSDLTIHIGLRSMNVTFASKEEGLMVFYYNEAMPFQRGNGFSEMQIALEKGLPNPILSVMEFILENSSAPLFEKAGFITHVFLVAALVVWGVNQIIYIMIPPLSVTISMLNGTWILISVINYIMMIQKFDFVIYVEGAKVDVYLGRSVIFMLFSSLFQLMPSFLVCIKLVPKTSFEVDFGTPWDRQYVLDHQKDRLTKKNIESHSEEETVNTFYSQKSKNSETLNVPTLSQNDGLKSKELITEGKLLEKLDGDSKLTNNQNYCEESHISMHNNLTVVSTTDKTNYKNSNHISNSDVKEEYDSINKTYNIKIKVTACDNPAFEHDSETNSQIVIDPQKQSHVTRLRLESDLNQLEGQLLSADPAIPDTVLPSTPAMFSAYDPYIVSSTPAAKEESIFVIPVVDNGEKSSRGLFRPPAELQSSTSVIVESEVKQPKKFWRTRVNSVNAVSKLAKGGQQRAMQREEAISSPRFGTVNPLLDVAPSVDCLKKIRTKSLS